MAHAEKCPVCEGKGWALKAVMVVPSDAQKTGDMITTSRPEQVCKVQVPSSEPCRGCDGKGWVAVADEVSHTVASIAEAEPDTPPPASLIRIRVKTAGGRTVPDVRVAVAKDEDGGGVVSIGYTDAYGILPLALEMGRYYASCNAGAPGDAWGDPYPFFAHPGRQDKAIPLVFKQEVPA